MKTFTLLLAFITIQFTGVAQVRIEKAGSPDFMLNNMNALNAGITSRMFFKTGNYYTGGMATTGTTANAARLSFFTQASNDHNALIERMTILNNGYVGIGNNNPVYPMHLKIGGIGFTQESPTAQAKIGFWTNNDFAYLQTHNSVPMHFATNNGSSQMTLTTAGRLGIGTTTPVSKLEVRGTTTMIQQAGELAALEIQGNIKLGGTNPVAFQVHALSPNFIKIDHPACNNNVNAMLLITPVKKYVSDPVFKGRLNLEYNPGDGHWYLFPEGKIVDPDILQVNLKNCDNTCSIVNVPVTEEFYFSLNQRFNVFILL